MRTKKENNTLFIDDNTSAQYWENFKNEAIEENKENNFDMECFVNSISIFDDDFVLKVMISIQENNYILIETAEKKREK